jgi:hypothetical protein
MASGITESDIRQFGGDDCYNEIPPLYHFSIALFFAALSLTLTYRWRQQLADGPAQTPKMQSGWAEKICFWVGLGSLLMTFYYKLATKRGLFILNPCHVALAMQLVLLAAHDNTSLLMRRLYAVWTAWLFCPFSALLLPHLEEISLSEFVLYYVEHIIILPLGPMVLHRRYGNPWPALKAHLAGFGTMIAFQTIVLVPFGRFLKVNLNFALCHSPAEPFYPRFGYHYFALEVFNLCIIAYFVHLASSLSVWAFSKAHWWAWGSRRALKESCD